MISIPYLVHEFFDIILLLMLIRVFLSWVPNINWQKEPVRSLRIFTDYIFEPFRRVIPPIGMLDISPIFAFIAIGLLRSLLVNFLYGLGF